MYWEPAIKAVVESLAAACEVNILDGQDDALIPIWLRALQSSLWVVGLISRYFSLQQVWFDTYRHCGWESVVIIGQLSFNMASEICCCSKSLQCWHGDAIATVLDFATKVANPCTRLQMSSNTDIAECNVHTARNPTWVLVMTRWLSVLDRLGNGIMLGVTR
jgi:hypothetical protein